ncbi:efflux RND transporter periplasmic adaptor subunit [Roseibium sp.]|uniref:efflux RND transporter periplasmic adaptor subunit n=1 Tax=Roseibium sp. TaxID=1936156 RepID=UPI003263EFB1
MITPPGKRRPPLAELKPAGARALRALLVILATHGAVITGTTEANAEQKLARVGNETPVAGEARRRIHALGRIEPRQSVEISSELSGILRAVHVSEGDAVELGDVLAELNTRHLALKIRKAELKIAHAEFELRSAIAAHKLLVSELDRAEKLQASERIAGKVYEEAYNKEEIAGLQISAKRVLLDTAQVEFQMLKLDLEKSRITAPINGIVVQRKANPGQTVAASLQAPTLFMIGSDLSTLTLKAKIHEADISRVQVGQPAQFAVDAYPGKVFRTRIDRISLYPTEIDSTITEYAVELTVANEERLIRPGMSAIVTIPEN